MAFSNAVSPDRLAEKDISCCWLSMLCSTVAAWEKMPFEGPIYRTDRLPAQQPGILVSGKIRDTEDQQVSYSTVTLSNAENGAIIATTRSDSTGSYLFTGLKTGHYLVNVVHIGYHQVIDVLEISPGVALDNNQLTLMSQPRRIHQ